MRGKITCGEEATQMREAEGGERGREKVGGGLRAEKRGRKLLR